MDAMPSPQFSARAASHIVKDSPYGGLALLHDPADGVQIGAVEADDICRVAVDPGGFILSDGFGGLRGPNGALSKALPVAWDNHLVAI
jgi:hypothetical protein